MRSEKSLVTGASGFIGTALCRRLIASGVEFMGFRATRWPPMQCTCGVPLSARSPETHKPPKVQWWNTDLADLEAARSLIRAVRPDATFHLASLATGSRDLEMVLPIFRNNFLTAFNLLISTAENSIGRIVLAGSFEEPDEANSVPCSPYAAAKWSASGYARMFHALYHVPTCHRENIHGVWSRSMGPHQVGPLCDYIAFARGSAQIEQRHSLG